MQLGGRRRVIGAKRVLGAGRSKRPGGVKEIENFVVIGKEKNDDFDVHDDEWSGSVHPEEPIEDVSERIKHLESRVEEASALIKEKDSRILELEALGRMQSGKTVIDSTNLLLSQSDLDRLYQEKMEAEIQCIIMTRAYQTWATLAEDQMALYEAQKSLSQDYKQPRLKLRTLRTEQGC